MISNGFTKSSMEVEHPALFGNYDKQTNQPTNQWKDMRAHREVTFE